MRRPTSGSGRVLLAGGLLLLASPVLFMGFVAVGIASDSSAEGVMLLLLAGSLLTGLVGVVSLLGGLVRRVWGARRRAEEHDAALIARMGRATTPGQAVAVQAHPTSRSWMQYTPLAALAVLLAVLFLPFPRLMKLAALVIAVAGLVVVFLLPRRRTATTVAGDWTPPVSLAQRTGRSAGDLPPAAQARMRELAHHPQGGRLWAWHHVTLLAREETVASLARRHGWDFRRADPTMPAGRHVVLNVIRGARDDIPFAAFDDVSTSETSVNGELTTVRMQPTTSVVMAFAAPFRLAVVPDRVGAGVRWGHIGHQVQLESGAFNDAHNVYCVDQVRARLVLNPAIMASLLDTPGLELVLEKGLLRIDRPGAFAAEPTVEAMVDLAYQVRWSASAAQVQGR